MIVPQLFSAIIVVRQVVEADVRTLRYCWSGRRTVANSYKSANLVSFFGAWHAARLLKIFEVSRGHGRHVFTAEDTNLEALIESRAQFGA